MTTRETGPAERAAADKLRELQCQQMRHDRAYHLDVWSLPIPERMAHYCIHFAKYAGQLLDENAGTRRAAVVDTAVIALAAANTINLDLRATETFAGLAHAASLEAFCRPEATAQGKRPLHEAYLPLLAQYARATDKACHLERYDVRGAYEAVVPALLRLAFAHLSETGEIAETLKARLREIESRTPLLSD
jgi:hypothetical protein